MEEEVWGWRYGVEKGIHLRVHWESLIDLILLHSIRRPNTQGQPPSHTYTQIASLEDSTHVDPISVTVTDLTCIVKCKKPSRLHVLLIAFITNRKKFL